MEAEISNFCPEIFTLPMVGAEVKSVPQALIKAVFLILSPAASGTKKKSSYTFLFVYKIIDNKAKFFE